MTANRESRSRLRTLVSVIAVGAVLSIVALLAFSLLTGRNVRASALSRIRPVLNLGRALIDSRTVSSYTRGDFTNVIFLHHSTGRNLINQGGVRERLTEAGYSFWDHDYNWEGLTRPDGSRSGYSYNVPDDNTDPDGLAEIFSQPEYRLPLNTLSGLLQHEVIAFKSCFPVSHISSDAQLERYRSYYLAIRDAMDAHPDKVFIVLTPPPLNPAETDPAAAARARAFADWLRSDEYLGDRPNVFTFDLFGHLAEDDPTAPDHNMLRADYREGADSHPNERANETVGPRFADFVVGAVESYRAQ